jgi:hypothetical protein
MKRCGLLVTTLASLVLTAGAVHHAGWLGRLRPATRSARRHDDAVTAAAWHYFQGGPRHWRNCLLNP